MIQEIVNFMEVFNNEKNINTDRLPKNNGLYIFLKIDNELNHESEIVHFINKKNEVETINNYNEDFIKKIKLIHQYSNYIDMNKQQKFDKLQQVHSTSPIIINFNLNLSSKKDSFIKEFENKNFSNEEIPKELIIQKLKNVKNRLDEYIENSINISHKGQLNSELKYLIINFKEKVKSILDKIINKENQDELNVIFEEKKIKEKDYLNFVLLSDKINFEEFLKIGRKNYEEKEYPSNNENNLQKNEFLTTYSSKKIFKTHKTAPFDISYMLSGDNLKILKDFESKLKISNPKVLPSPLPIFIFKQELNNEIIKLYKDDNKLGFKEIVEKLYDEKKTDLQNYYLIHWSNNKQIFNDVDFVPNFIYKIEFEIENLFKITKDKIEIPNKKLKTIFDFEKNVFIILCGNKYNKIDYFGDIKQDQFDNNTNSYILCNKYRKTIYDFIYKSQIKAINIQIFYDLIFKTIVDNIKNNAINKIKEKLNIWFSLYEVFNANNQNKINMATKLKNYQNLVEELKVKENIEEDRLKNIKEEEFMFLTGQVIAYLLTKSKSGDNSLILLEPYTQKSKCTELKKAIANDVARYKHENFSNNFRNIASIILTFETEKNLKEFLPELLAGVFAPNKLFSDNKII